MNKKLSGFFIFIFVSISVSISMIDFSSLFISKKNNKRKASQDLEKLTKIPKNTPKNTTNNKISEISIVRPIFNRNNIDKARILKVSRRWNITEEEAIELITNVDERQSQ